MGFKEKGQGETGFVEKRVAVLGSTGSIGTQTLDVIRYNPGRFKVVALTCGKNIELLKEQIEEFKPSLVVASEEEDARKLKEVFQGSEIRFSFGDEGLIEAASMDADLVVNALMGVKGLLPTLAAIDVGHDVAFANKETLVAGGELVMKRVREKGAKLLPVDSEHSAIFQCLEGNKDREIKRILLTASGGPFRERTLEELKGVTPEEALNHPNWKMGKKITIDSATMMNKGLEIIEARWLFDVDVDDIQVIIHPESIIHSAVEFKDKAVLAQLGTADMRVPISLALGYPERIENGSAELDFFGKAANLTFREPDYNTFKCLGIAVDSLKRGGIIPAIMNGANEVLVQAFLDRRIGFTDIADYTERIVNSHEPGAIRTVQDIIDADRVAREEAEELISSCQ